MMAIAGAGLSGCDDDSRTPDRPIQPTPGQRDETGQKLPATQPTRERQDRPRELQQNRAGDAEQEAPGNLQQEKPQGLQQEQPSGTRLPI
jgi:hypothetical protein